MAFFEILGVLGVVLLSLSICIALYKWFLKMTFLEILGVFGVLLLVCYILIKIRARALEQKKSTYQKLFDTVMTSRASDDMKVLIKFCQNCIENNEYLQFNESETFSYLQQWSQHAGDSGENLTVLRVLFHKEGKSLAMAILNRVVKEKKESFIQTFLKLGIVDITPPMMRQIVDSYPDSYPIFYKYVSSSKVENGLYLYVLSYELIIKCMQTSNEPFLRKLLDADIIDFKSGLLCNVLLEFPQYYPVLHEKLIEKKILNLFTEVANFSTFKKNLGILDGTSPFITAIISQNVVAVQLMLDTSSIELSKARYQNMNVFHLTLAPNYYHTKIFELLAAYAKKTNEIHLFTDTGCFLTTPVYLAVQKGNIPALDVLVTNGAPIDLKSTILGGSLLHACSGSSWPMVETLVNKYKLNVNEKDALGQTPIYKAIECNKPQIIEFLLNKGADPNLVDNFETSPIQYAVILRSSVAVEMLLKFKADINVVTKAKETLWTLAIQDNKAYITKIATIAADTTNYVLKSQPQKEALMSAFVDTMCNPDSIIAVMLQQIQSRDPRSVTEALDRYKKASKSTSWW